MEQRSKTPFELEREAWKKEIKSDPELQALADTLTRYLNSSLTEGVEAIYEKLAIKAAEKGYPLMAQFFRKKPHIV